MSNNEHTRPRQLILCAGTVPYATFEQRVKAARHADFDAITLFPQQYLNARHREKRSIEDMQKILRDYNIVVDAVDPLLDWFTPQPSSSEQLIFDIAEQLGAKSINAAPAFAPKLEHAAIVDSVRGLCKRAAQRGLRVDFEPLPWTIIPNYPTMFSILADAEQSNAGITLDCLHFFRSGGVVDDFASLSVEEAKRITNIQLCDVPTIPLVPGFADKLSIAKGMLTTAWDGIRVMGFKAMKNALANAHTGREDAQELMREASFMRVLPGQGNIPLVELFSTLDGLGVCPDIGPEIFSLALNAMKADLTAEKAMASCRAYIN